MAVPAGLLLVVVRYPECRLRARLAEGEGRLVEMAADVVAVAGLAAMAATGR